MNKLIWIVNSHEPIPDGRNRLWRSDLLTEEMAGRGHHVVRWRSSFNHYKKQQLSSGSELIKAGMFYHQYMGVNGYRSHIGLARIFSHRALGREFIRLAEHAGRKPDLIHVSNVPLELSHACCEFAVRHQIPVIVDIRDLWPDNYVEFLPKPLSMLKSPGIKLLNFLSFRMRKTLQKATALTALTQSFLDWAYEKAPDRNKQLDAVFPMAHPVLPVLDEKEKSQLRRKHNIPLDAIVVIYSGNIGYQTDFDLLVESAEQLGDDNIHFLMAGNGPRYEELRARTEKMENITLPGWLEKQTLEEYLLVSDLGFVGYYQDGPFMKSIPNKFPEYASAGLALLCMTRGIMWREVEKWNCGICVERNDFARRLKSISQTPELLALCKQNARRMHRELYDAMKIKAAMAAYVETVIARSGG